MQKYPYKYKGIPTPQEFMEIYEALNKLHEELKLIKDYLEVKHKKKNNLFLTGFKGLFNNDRSSS